MIKQLLLASMLTFAPMQQNSEDVNEPTSVEVITSEEVSSDTTTSVVDENTSSDTTAEPTTSEIENEIQKYIEEFLSQYFNSNFVASIINWAIDAGLLSAIALIYLKYRKFKSKTIEEIVKEVKKTIEDNLGDSFKNLSTEEIQKITASVDTLAKDIDTLKKALVLAQDRTAEGKIALLDLIQNTSTSDEVKKGVEVVKETIKEEQKVEQEVKEVVKNDYEKID